MIYLDHNATTPLRPEAFEAMQAAWASVGNPSSSHTQGRKARRLLEDARDTVAELLGARAEEVVFTSGATEANNLALFGLAGTSSPDRILAAPIEHPCVLEPLKQLASFGWHIEMLPIDAAGRARLPATANVRFATLQLANHETGAIQPVQELVSLVGTVHTDAAQVVGKLPVDFRRLGVTTLSFSAHKFGGPIGVGGLIVRSGTVLTARTFGGHQQRGIRPGTEPVALAVGMAAALRAAVSEMSESVLVLNALRNRLWDQLRSRLPTAVLNGPPLGHEHSLPTTLNVSFPGCRADLLMMALDLAGVVCSTGSACSSGSLLPSPVIAAMGVSEDVLKSAMRFSVGRGLAEADMDRAAETIAECVNRTKS